MGKSRGKLSFVPPVLNKLASSGSGRITKSVTTAKRGLQPHSAPARQIPSLPDDVDDLRPKVERRLGIRRFDGAIESHNQDRGSWGQDPLRTVLKKVPLKKTKRKAKKDDFRKRIQAIQELEQEKKAAVERAKTVIVGDLNPLLQALSESTTPTKAESTTSKAKKLKRSLQEAQTDREAGAGVKKGRMKMKVKRRDQEIAESLEYFATGLAALAAKKPHD